MLIIIGSDGNNLESSIAKRFGHAEYFIQYNTETKSFEAFVNNEEGHNHDNLQEFLDNGIEVFIVGNIGPHAFKIINTPKSKIFLARKMTVQESIEKFLKDELKQLTESTVKQSIEHNDDNEHHHNPGDHHHNHKHGKQHYGKEAQ
jgi:predicted Fe-Mo cluster-binding NifX family protein